MFENTEELASHVAKLIDACEQYSDEQKKDRESSLEYYEGEMKDIPSEKGRSSAVSKDIRTTIKKLMPSIMRTILSNDKIAEYEPQQQDDEDSAEQATDYINYVVVPECGAEKAIYDAIFDALVLKTGILKWTAYKRKKAKVYEYTDQDEDALLGLEGEDGVEILDIEATPETDQDVLALNPDAQRYSFKLKRIDEDIDIRLEAVPRGSFLIYPDSISIEESPIVGERQIVTRSELISRGYDKDKVESLSCYTKSNDDEDDYSGDNYSEVKAQMKKAMEQVLLYEVYVQLDQDGDGIAELYKLCISEASSDSDDKKHTILFSEQVEEAPYADVVAERDAHQFEGRSLAEDVVDIQRIKTSLLRETLDNIYWQNKNQPYIDVSKLTQEGMEAVNNPEFGKTVWLKPNTNAREAVQFNTVPVVADKSFSMMGYMDESIKDRTGVTDQSGGVDPEAFQNMTATTAQIMSESGISQAEMLIRTLTRGGIRKAFRGLLKLVVAHADKPRTVRLKGNWTDYDPRHWNSEMDCTVNVGLGAGSKERDMNVLQVVLGLQREIISTMGADNPYVKPDQLYNVLEKITETAGFPSATPYFTKPDPQEIEQKLQQAQQPSESQQKVAAQMQLEQMKAAAKTQIEEAQMQADIRVKEAELAKDAQMQMLKAEQAKEIAIIKGELDLLKHREKLQLDREKAGLIDMPLGEFEQGELYVE